MYKAVLLLLFPLLLSAQEYRATLTGAVTDATGGVVPGGEVTAANLATGVVTRSQANAEGVFVIPYLLPGAYRLRVERAGFKSFERGPIELRVGGRTRVDVVLEVGQVTDQVTVTAEAPLLETATSNRGQVIENRKITDLPLNSRNPFTLVNLATGVQYTGSMIFFRPYDSGPIGAFSINGGRQGFNEFQIDGAPNNLLGSNSLNYVPPVEATQEFKVQTNTYDAQFGRTGGGVISVSIKPGTNKFHGAAYEYLRRTGLEANQFVNNATGTPRSQRVVDQYGFEIDGPVSIPKLYRGKERTFFMASVERYRESKPLPTLGTIPTAEHRNGDYSQTRTAAGRLYTIYDPLTVAANPAFDRTRPVSLANLQYVRTPFTGNRIPASRFNPVALNVFKDIPLPNRDGDPVTQANNWFAPEVAEDAFRNYIARVDHTFSDTWKMYGRWSDSYRDGSRVNANGWYTNAGTSPTGFAAQRRFKNEVVDAVGTLSPQTVLSLRLSHNRWRYYKTGPPQDFSYLGFPKSLMSQIQNPSRYPQFTWEGYLSASERELDWSTHETYAAQGSLMKILGRHTMKFGAEFRLMHAATIVRLDASGRYNFTRSWTTSNPQVNDANSGNAIASFLLGYMGSATATLNSAPYLTWKYPVLFYQDDWQASKRLTLSTGLRWDYESPVTERFDRQNRGFDYGARSPLQVPGYDLRGGLLFAGTGGQPRGGFRRDLTNWQPRFGLAYKMLNSKPLVFRAGFGRYYLATWEFGGGTGFTQTTTAQTGTADFRPLDTLSDPFPRGLIQPSGASLGLATNLGSALSFGDPSRVVPYVWQYSAGFQYELIPGLLMEASYAGSQTAKIQINRGLNFLSPEQLALGTPYLSAAVPNPFFGVLPSNTPLGAQATIQRRNLLLQYPHFSGLTAQYLSRGRSWYNSAQLKVEQRFKQGFSYLFSYTVSKTMEAVSYLNAADTRLARELVSFDVPQRMVISGVYELPFGPKRRWLHRGLGSHIVGAWQLSGVATLESGQPMSYPDFYIHGNPKLTGAQNINRWFDTSPSIWVQRPPDTLRVTPLRSPNIRRHAAPQADVTLLREFLIREGHRFQLKVSAFNAANTPVFNFPDTNPNSVRFGMLPLAQLNSPRSVEIGFRYAF